MITLDSYGYYSYLIRMMPLMLLKFSAKKVQNEKGCSISCIRSDYGGEFENYAFENFCNDFGIEHKFSSPRTP